MEDISLETPHPRLNTPTTPTPLGQSISDHATANISAVMNGSEQHYLPSQQLSNQQATALSDKLHPSDPYDWQLLPQKDLDSIAYNSRRQRKARLRENPPTCAQCPKAKFTSMAMLSVHYLSRRHLARDRRQDQRHDQGHDTERRVIQSELTPSTLDNHATIARNSESHSVAMEKAVSRIISDNQVQLARAGTTATQKKRKLERDRKKARARLAKQVDSIPAQQTPSDSKLRVEEDGEKAEATMAANASALEGGRRSGHKGHEMSTALLGVASKSVHKNLSLQTITASDTAASFTGITSLSPNTTQREPQQQQQQQQQQQHWHCSICRSSWRQEKAWKGHLLSAQHLRHTLTTMQQAAPDVRPYGRLDVLASMDPFGWGTAAGVEEEEEEEEAEEEENEEYDDDGKGDDRVMNDDDMDLSD